mgnify:CR=1 FL=1
MEIPTAREQQQYKEDADEILAIVKEALPGLAKEAGYVKLAEDQSSAR